MAYYRKNGRVIRYSYTRFAPFLRVPSSYSDWLEFQSRYEETAREPAFSLVRPADIRNRAPLRMRAPAAESRASFEAEAARFKLSPEEAQAIIRGNPTDADGFYRRGNAYKDLYDYNRAIEDYSEVIRLDPANAYAFYKRGLCFSAIGRYDLAADNFKQANALKSAQEHPWLQHSRSWYSQDGY
jgi:tetratricopeptide (TPR) repeat protein